jgi:hypothetical protein
MPGASFAHQSLNEGRVNGTLDEIILHDCMTARLQDNF